MLVAGLSAVEKLRAENPEAISRCTAVAGLSLGEYTALVFAGALSLDDALRLVKARAEAMEEAAKKTKGGMLSIVGLDDVKLQEVCDKARSTAKAGQVIGVANLLFPEGRVVSGNDELLAQVEKLANEAGASKVSRLHVSGAFHTPLMAPASSALKAALQKVELSLPRIPVYSNVTAKPFASVEEIREGLAAQLCSPVLWEQSLKQILADGHRQLWELSPRAKQLKAMVNKIDKKAAKAMKLVEV
jgi:[acyl-carrier-protein] S-malonyltransferase